jgi:hypothetical protein
MSEFLSRENRQLLWDVIISEDTVRQSSNEMKLRINSIFNENIEPFYETEKKNHSNLLQINNQFIKAISSHINCLIIPREQKKELITRDEIENKRMNEFEKKYNLKQNEFTSAMALPIPPTPNFSDKMDTPINEIEMELKRAIAKRNYDIEQINRNVVGSNINTTVKYIKIDNTNIEDGVYKKDIIDLNPAKHVTWAEKDPKHIFSKLKVIPEEPVDEYAERKEIVDKIDKIQQELTELRYFIERMN